MYANAGCKAWVDSECGVIGHNLNMMFEVVGLEGVLLNRHLDLDLMYDTGSAQLLSHKSDAP